MNSTEFGHGENVIMESGPRLGGSFLTEVTFHNFTSYPNPAPPTPYQDQRTRSRCPYP